MCGENKNTALQVVRAMLELSRHREVGPRESTSVWLTLAAIQEQLSRGGIEILETPTESILLELLESDVSVVLTSEDGSWSVNTSAVISMVCHDSFVPDSHKAMHRKYQVHFKLLNTFAGCFEPRCTCFTYRRTNKY